jgi:hypothetical protein
MQGQKTRNPAPLADQEGDDPAAGGPLVSVRAHDSGGVRNSMRLWLASHHGLSAE